MKKIVILGASGSIGRQTLDVVRQHPTSLQCVGISVGRKIDWLRDLLKEQSFERVCVQFEADAIALRVEFPHQIFLFGETGLIELSTFSSVDTVVNALVGFSGLAPTMAAIRAKKEIALANKETLVVAGSWIIQAAKENNVNIVPIDSEHSAIFQCLQGNRREDIRKLIITASGGSFRDKSIEELADVTVDQALSHPNWSMGPKITIDSATLVNKAFEVIEAHWLFDVPYDQIEAVIHPQSIIHSMVEYVDGSVIAQLGSPDMRLPIQYALLYPTRDTIENHAHLDFTRISELRFAAIKPERYPLFYRILSEAKTGGNRTTVINAANEVAIEAFLKKEIRFTQIDEIIQYALDNVPMEPLTGLEDTIACDRASRAIANRKIGG